MYKLDFSDLANKKTVTLEFQINNKYSFGISVPCVIAGINLS
jgi:hypothetical protein